MSKDDATITVDMDRTCTRCHKPGASPNGLCMTCAFGRKEITVDEDDKEWEQRVDVETIADELIARWHPHLGRAKIAGLGRPKAGKSKGRPVWAKLRLSTAAERALLREHNEATPDYVLVVALDVWTKLPKAQRLALVDHELCHAAGQDENGTWTLLGHDIEEFGVVLVRHGAWRNDVRSFVELAKGVELPQMTLDEVAGEGRS